MKTHEEGTKTSRFGDISNKESSPVSDHLGDALSDPLSDGLDEGPDMALVGSSVQMDFSGGGGGAGGSGGDPGAPGGGPGAPGGGPYEQYGDNTAPVQLKASNSAPVQAKCSACDAKVQQKADGGGTKGAVQLEGDIDRIQDMEQAVGTPSITMNVPSKVTSGDWVPIEGSAKDGNEPQGDDPENHANLKIKLSSDVQGDLADTGPYPDGSWSSSQMLSDGTHQLTAVAKDTAGAEATATASVKLDYEETWETRKVEDKYGNKFSRKVKCFSVYNAEEMWFYSHPIGPDGKPMSPGEKDSSKFSYDDSDPKGWNVERKPPEPVVEQQAETAVDAPVQTPHPVVEDTVEEDVAPTIDPPTPTLPATKPPGGDSSGGPSGDTGGGDTDTDTDTDTNTDSDTQAVTAKPDTDDPDYEYGVDREADSNARAEAADSGAGEHVDGKRTALWEVTDPVGNTFFRRVEGTYIWNDDSFTLDFEATGAGGLSGTEAAKTGTFIYKDKEPKGWGVEKAKVEKKEEEEVKAPEAKSPVGIKARAALAPASAAVNRYLSVAIDAAEQGGLGRGHNMVFAESGTAYPAAAAAVKAVSKANKDLGAVNVAMKKEQKANEGADGPSTFVESLPGELKAAHVNLKSLLSGMEGAEKEMPKAKSIYGTFRGLRSTLMRFNTSQVETTPLTTVKPVQIPADSEEDELTNQAEKMLDGGGLDGMPLLIVRNILNQGWQSIRGRINQKLDQAWADARTAEDGDAWGEDDAKADADAAKKAADLKRKNLMTEAQWKESEEKRIKAEADEKARSASRESVEATELAVEEAQLNTFKDEIVKYYGEKHPFTKSLALVGGNMSSVAALTKDMAAGDLSLSDLVMSAVTTVRKTLPGEVPLKGDMIDAGGPEDDDDDNEQGDW